MAGVDRISLWRIGLWLRREVLDRVLFHGRPLVCALAFVWRRLLFRTTFVAITGSLGKTTAKECVAACLAARYRTACIPVDSNDDGWLALSVLRVRPWHRYAVLEVAAGAPGRMFVDAPHWMRRGAAASAGIEWLEEGDGDGTQAHELALLQRMYA